MKPQTESEKLLNHYKHLMDLLVKNFGQSRKDAAKMLILTHAQNADDKENHVNAIIEAI